MSISRRSEISIWTLEDQIRIHVRACNILSDYLQFSTDQASISLHVQACVLARAGDEAFVSIVGENCTYIFSTFPSLRSDLKWTLTRRGEKDDHKGGLFLNACVF